MTNCRETRNGEGMFISAADFGIWTLESVVKKVQYWMSKINDPNRRWFWCKSRLGSTLSGLLETAYYVPAFVLAARLFC